MTRLFVLASLLVVAVGAMAQDNPNRGFYAGAHVGLTDFSDWIELDDSLEIDDKDTAVGVHAGYRFFRYLALEMAYTDYGSGSLENYADLSAAFDSRSFLFTVNGTLPLSSRFMLEGRAGVNHSENRIESSTILGSVNEKETHMGLALAAGFRFKFTQKLDLSLLYENIDSAGFSDIDWDDLFNGTNDGFDIEDLRTIKLGFSYQF